MGVNQICWKCVVELINNQMMTLQDKLEKVDQLQAQINAHGPLSSELKKKINYKFRLDWNHYSNAMEGGTLTMEETRSVMIGNITVQGKPLRDVLEMKGHDEIVLEILAMGEGQKRLSEKRIKDVHRAIMHEEDEDKKRLIGRWKEDGNHVINYRNEKIHFTPPAEVAERIHQLLNQTNAELDALENKKSKNNALHPALIAFKFHLEYVSIHPFYDGNGRTARILANLLLISRGFPPVIIRTAEKDVYYRYLADIQAYGGEPDLFYGYMADLLMRSQQLILDAIKGKNIFESSDWEKQLNLLSQQISNDEDLQPKTNELIFQRFQDSFKVLLEKSRVRLAKFDHFFVTAKVTEQLLPMSGDLDTLLTMEDRINKLHKEEKLPEVNQIQLHFHWKGYKGNGTTIFDMSGLIKIELNQEFLYVISSDERTMPKIEKRFTARLTGQEINRFIDEYGTVLVQRLERRIGDHQN